MWHNTDRLGVKRLALDSPKGVGDGPTADFRYAIVSGLPDRQPGPGTDTRHNTARHVEAFPNLQLERREQKIL
jgi:hypothetical protein